MIIPDYIAPIVGHRAWCLFDGHLRSPFSAEVWPPGQVLEAKCAHYTDLQSGHQAPQVDCSCGIYAMKSEEQVDDSRFPGCMVILGEVYLWGTIVEHTFGWRAQFAYPKSFVLSTYTSPDIEEMKSMFHALTVYGADISLANRAMNITLWTKRSGYTTHDLDVPPEEKPSLFDTLYELVKSKMVDFPAAPGQEASRDP